MPIRLDAHELVAVLKLTPAHQNIMVVGKHGIGKSELIRDFYTQQGLPVESFFLGQMSDPGDLIGLMHKDEKTGRSVFLPPYWWPLSQAPMVLFLDELNRARPEILQAVYDLALNRRLAGKSLPPGSRVVAAINHGDEYQLTELDPALVSRFNLYEFTPTIEDWLLWARVKGLDSRVTDFIQEQPFHLDGARTAEDLAGFSDLSKTPDRRAWVRVAEFIQPHLALEALHVKAIAGMVGTAAAIALQQYLGATQQVAPEQVLRHWRDHQAQVKKLALHELIQLNERLLLWLHGLAQPIPAADAKTFLANLLAYLKMLKAARHNEALAHFASLLENPKFARAMAICSGSVEILTLLTDYIAGIKG
ncbi:MAG TPA: AAA family ATPase [Candidatus Contendobacter sp.]|nr:AAA family ATPase [Candidatus Contendobacter sp.]